MTDIDKLIERNETAATGAPNCELLRTNAQALRELQDPQPDNEKILSDHLPTAIEEYLRVCGRDLKYNAFHLLSESKARIEVLEGALREISEGKGRYSMDPLEHAGNTIEDMKELAKEALATESSDG